MSDDEMTDEQVMEQLQVLSNTAAVPEDKHNAHTFLNAVATSKDTLKVGYLKEEEVGVPKLSTRTLKELQLYCSKIAADEDWAEYFNQRAEILTSTSLSKDAKLLDLAVIQRREVGSISKPRKINKGWFGSRKEQPNV